MIERYFASDTEKGPITGLAQHWQKSFESLVELGSKLRSTRKPCCDAEIDQNLYSTKPVQYTVVVEILVLA